MDSKLKQKIDLMVDNYYMLKKGFKWETPLLNHFGAMLHAAQGKSVDIEALEEIKNYIKAETSWSSYFRGTSKFVLTNLLYFEEDYKTFFKDMQTVYEGMKEMGFGSSQYSPLAAYTIVKNSNRDEWNYKIDRMSDFYHNMKENHQFLTSYDDYVFAAVLATSELNVRETANNIERCYSYLNEEQFYKSNDLQTLSHVLAIGEEGVEEKCNRAINIYRKLKEKGCKLQYSGLATIGLLALITKDTDKITEEVSEAYNYIYEQEGYGFWSLDKSMRIIMASTLVSDSYVDDIKKGVFQVALGNSINAIVIAQQQAAMTAALAASASASAASSS